MSDRELFEIWLGNEKEISAFCSKEKANVHSFSSYFSETVLKKRITGFSPDLIVRNEHGKPVLKDLSYSFNLSHSGDHYALLLCSCDYCGIDIQTVENPGKFENALKSVLTDREYELLEHRGSKDDFFQLWSVKEAFIKAVGSSIWYGRDYDFGTEPGLYSDRWFQSNGLYIYSTELYSGVFLSMAVPSRPDKIDFLNFSSKYFSS